MSHAKLTFSEFGMASMAQTEDVTFLEIIFPIVLVHGVWESSELQRDLATPSIPSLTLPIGTELSRQ